MSNSVFDFNGKPFKINSLLGKGKSGYSYLIENEDEKYVLKKIHDEPCSYYQFDDKFGAEIIAYQKLKSVGIRIPELIHYNKEEQYIVKQYIEGKTATQLIAENRVTNTLINQMFTIARKCQSEQINIDYFPSNFVVNQSDELIYIDYEFNPYSEDWNFKNWGIYYWANHLGMKAFLETGNHLTINLPDSGIPIKEPFTELVKTWIKQFDNQLI